ncbi:hypothetical protein JTE90_008260 [Oedothorax gibbosus]|uniref:Reverse transcriptase/retrotransposon-derived protein RNase H-like domain-containing protein n=1 Tax=Oedothorax gibbosus TaxID=931172 RepID=A0AAV6TQ96_9ARAC|nr:hypothetical protein JTE90_008260 [Oedothorax gibbosus]
MRLKKAGLRAKKEKCLFGVPEVEFLGFRVDKTGIHPSKGKVEAIRAAPKPENKQQLQAFLGLVNFYHSFLPNKASIAEPLHRLLDGDAPWNWSSDHTKAFNSLKQLISSESVLSPFDDSLPIVLTCDASPYGVCAVLAHVLPDGREAPVAFHSRTLTSTERNYAQLDKEALAIISGVKKFHHFLYGHHFTIVTDHQPLLGIFNRGRQLRKLSRLEC